MPEACVEVEVSPEQAKDDSSENVANTGTEQTEIKESSETEIVKEIDLEHLPPTPADSTPTSDNSAADSPLLHEQPEDSTHKEQSRAVSVDA